LEEKLGEGTFGEVYKARSNAKGGVFALKKILMHNEKDGFPITALREIKLLKMLSHPNIIRLEEMAVERIKAERKKAVLYMVFPYMEHDLSGLLDNQTEVFLSEAHIKCYMMQLLRGLKYLHNSHILHRDMKAANLLINNRGILQIADFGLARHYDEPVPQLGRGNGEAQRDYTCLVVTRWYRPPELLLQLRRYTPAIDMWGAGCVFGEMFKRKPILAGKTDLNQAQIIFDLVGSPNEENMPGWNELPGCDGVKAFGNKTGNLRQAFSEWVAESTKHYGRCANQFIRLSEQALDLLSKLLTLDWRKRINAIDALEHLYFKTHPLPARPGEIPRWKDSHELDRRTARGNKQALPPAPAGGTVGGGANGEWAGNGTQANGASWNCSDNGPPAGNRGYSRAPPGAYDSRGPPRRSAWGDDRGPPPGHQGRHPPPNQMARRGPGAAVDTYIPSYDDDRRNDRRSREHDEPPRRDDWRSRDNRRDGYGYRDRDREYIDPDRPPIDRNRGRDRRTRSRSPPREEYPRDYRARDRTERDYFRR
jgi:serine/threonine-protein kinase BUR1